MRKRKFRNSKGKKFRKMGFRDLSEEWQMTIYLLLGIAGIGYFYGGIWLLFAIFGR